MKEIKCLIESMYMELDAAECYYYKAVNFKDSHPQIAQTYAEIASQELGHCDKFHTAATNLINKFKATDSETPKGMEEIWKFEHTRLIEEYDELKYKISKFTI